MKQRTLRFLFLIGFGYLFAFAIIYKALESPTIYNRFFSGFMPTYENQNGAIYPVNKQFTRIDESLYASMDAAHYSYIKNNLYKADPNDIETNYNFAFFPLFPMIWKFFSGLGIVVFNYFLHFAAIVILAFTFCRKSIITAVLVILALPTLTVFLLPYTEALFMFSISIALLGYKEKKQYLYIIGLLLASMTRPIFLLFICALIATEIFQLLQQKKAEHRPTLVAIAVMIGGTFAIAAFQHFCFHVSFLSFISSQKNWGTFFRIPETINDWSFESFGMNIWALVFCCLFGTVVLVSALIKKKTAELNSFDFWYYFSWIFLLATCIYVLFFQGGCLHSLYRYTLCSPFFYVIVFQHINNKEFLSLKFPILLFVLLFISCLIFFGSVSYPNPWGFSKTGFIILTVAACFFVCIACLNSFAKYTGLTILIFSSIVWNCYLYNMFFSHAWNFL